MTTLPRTFRRTRHPVRKSGPLILAICAIPLSGCIPVPLALPDPEPFTAERMTSIRLGETTRDDVRALLANWTYETDAGMQTAHLEPQVLENGRYWAFALPRQLGDLAVVGLLVSPYGLVPGLFGEGDNYEDFWVLFEFDEDAIVDDVWMAGEGTDCSVGGACYHRGRFQIIADEAADASARTGNAMDDACVVYAYADDYFELPVTVTDGRHTGWLFEKTSFARFDVVVGTAMPSARYEHVPGSAVPFPVDCVAGAVHYVALRPRDERIEATDEKPSAGERAIAQRTVVDRLLSVERTQPPDWRPTTRPWFGETAVIDGHEQPLDAADLMLLAPGQYTVRVHVYADDLQETFDAEAERRYQVEYDEVCCFACGPWRVKIPGGDEARAQLCSGREQTGSSYLRTSWIEDAATSRVVGGDKWCASDADCPASQCALQPGQPSGVCTVPELR
jgi:hypothetical protein